MKMLWSLAFVALLSACSPPPAAQAPKIEPAIGHETPDPAPAAVADAVRAALAADVGKPVLFDATTLNIEGEWAWVIGQPRAPDGGAFDFSTTRYASAVEHGVFDGGGTTYALLRRDGEGWRIVDIAVGPTDVAWEDWPARYGAPPALLGLE